MQARIEARITTLLEDAQHRLTQIQAMLAEGHIDQAVTHAHRLQEDARAIHRGLTASHSLLARIEGQGLRVASGPSTRGPEAQ